jgi:hypothetical protein
MGDKGKSKQGPVAKQGRAAGPDAPRDVVLRCLACGAALTPALAPWRGQPLTLLDGQDALPRGFYWQSPPGTEFWQGAGPDQIVVNRHDLVGLTPSGKNNQGCCGPSGMDGLNLLCPCGRPIATDVADCWTPHMALFGPRVGLGAATGLDEPGTSVFTIGGEPLRSLRAFVAWAHSALGATAWYGDDVEMLVLDWLTRTGDDETLCIVWLNSETSKAAGVPVRAIEAAAAKAHEGSARRRLAFAFF